ncbi:hypothetical protein [Winogradskyella aurantiaca]|uniref:hypothetical protein n=1 Tax=Winogradskyella aurantiaca TaxID=2219558 RepID=UPI000E1CA3C7|nr:hypothetical protein [Winogradskyella aurantiaca]
MNRTLLLWSALGLLHLGQAQSFTRQQRQDHLQRLQDSTSWDTTTFEIDKQLIGMDMAGPFELAAYPVPKYELLTGDAEVAMGQKDYQYEVAGKHLYSSNFYVYNNPVNQAMLGDLPNMVFFQILVVGSTADRDAQAIALSRNHPDYYGQGYIRGPKANIEYAAFITAEGEAFAIVNTRLFHLNQGRTIIIAPQEDGSLRSLQLDSPDMTSKSMDKLTQDILKKQAILNFISASGTI